MIDKTDRNWKELKIIQDQVHWKLGTFDLILRNTDLDLVVGFSNNHENVEPSNDAYDDSMLSWQRWIKPEGNDTIIKIQPKLPDRPLVVSPIDSISIPSGEMAKFFISVPLWLDIAFKEKSHGHNMLSIPTEVLSDTWFGSNVEGTYCYHLRSKARRELKDSVIKDNRVICPIQIKNRSPDVMIFTQFCIHMNYLNLYQVGDSMWTNQVNIKFRDDIRGSSIEYTQNVLSD